jgi:hypothetical protein
MKDVYDIDYNYTSYRGWVLLKNGVSVYYITTGSINEAKKVLWLARKGRDYSKKKTVENLVNWGKIKKARRQVKI